MEKIIIIEDGLNLYNKTGQGQYSKNIFNLLKDIGYNVEMKRKPFLEKIKNSTIKRILYILWLNFVFPFLVFNKNSNTIIFTNTITPIFKIPGKKYYPVLHDLWAYKSPDTVSFVQKIYTKIVILSISHTYSKIITVSETIKQEIIDFFNCKEDNVKVIYNTFSFGENPIINYSENQQKDILKNYCIEPKKYILSVATLNKRKNIPMLIDAYNQLDNNDIKLVLVGGTSTEKFKNVDNKNIIFTGYVEDETLKVLYKHALLYVFPSIYEGFGIPIIDAQNFGVPVLCSDIKIFREIAGLGAIYFSLDSNSLKKCITNILLKIDLKTYQQNENNEFINKLTQEAKYNTNKYKKDRLEKQIGEIFPNDN